MRALATLALTLGFLAGGAPSAAQTFGFGAHAGVSIPTGDYSDLADVGFSGGLDFRLPLAMVTPALSWYSSIDAVGHSASAEAIGGGFLTVPLLTGVRFDLGTLGMIRPFGTGQLGLAFIRSPEVGAVDAATNTEFAFALGGGLQLTDNLYAGLRWFNLGSVDFEPPELGSPSVSFLDIYLGFGF